MTDEKLTCLIKRPLTFAPLFRFAVYILPSPAAECDVLHRIRAVALCQNDISNHVVPLASDTVTFHKLIRPQFS